MNWFLGAAPAASWLASGIWLVRAREIGAGAHSAACTIRHASQCRPSVTAFARFPRHSIVGPVHPYNPNNPRCLASMQRPRDLAPRTAAGGRVVDLPAGDNLRMKSMEPKKEPKRDPFRKGPDKKSSPVNNNLVLSLLVAGAW